MKAAATLGSRVDIGAGERNRTSDLMITNQALYQLSYSSTRAAPDGAAGGSELYQGRSGAAASARHQPRGRVRTMISTASASTPGGSGGSPSTLTSAAGMSVSCPLATS